MDGPVTGFAGGDGGVIFVASHHLAAFNGTQWQPIEVGNASRVFAVAASADARRIWVGASGTLGYLERSPQGEWKFVSLKAQLAAAGVPDGDELRYVFPTPRGAFFVGFARAYYWDGERMAVWSLPTRLRLYAFRAGEQVLIYQMGIGLLQMDVAGPKLWLAEQSLPAAPPIVAMAALPDGTPVAVFPNGVFRWTDAHWHRLDGVSDFLQGKRASHCTALPDGTLAIATTYSGLILADAAGTVREVIDSQQGLARNLVSGLWVDPTDQLWVGLEMGFARMDGNTHASLFDYHSRLSGADTRHVEFYDGRPHIITRRFVYSLVRASGAAPAYFSMDDLTWTTIHDSAVVDGDLWVADAGGLWRLPKSGGPREPMLKADVFLLLALRAIPGGILSFESNACKAWLPDAGKSNPVDLKQALESMPVSAIEDLNGAVWLSLANGHVRKFTWDAEKRALNLISDLSPGRGLPAGATHPVLTTLSGATLAFTEKGIVAYDPATNAFSPAPGLSEFMGIVGATAGTSGYWVVRTKVLHEGGSEALIKVTAPASLGQPFTYEPVVAPGLDQVGEITSVSPTTSDDCEVLWVAGPSGVLRLETAFLRRADPPPELFFQRIQTDTEGPVALKAGPSAIFKADMTRVEFSFAPGAIVAGDSAFQYETRLEGVEHGWSPPQPSGTRDFSGLAPGRYTFAARALDRFGRAGPPVEYRFSIKAPWYQQAWFLLFCSLLAMLAIWGMHRLRLAQQSARMNLRLESQAIERKRIAQELHDTLLQGFIGIGLKLDAIATSLPESLSVVRDQLRKILDQSDQYLTEARRSVMKLRSATLEDGGDFSHALSVAGARLTEGTGIQLLFSVHGERRPLPPLIESNLLRIGEEAVSNAVRHAQATRVDLDLKFGNKEVSLRIQDNGRGFEPHGPEAAKSGHFGLLGIQERANAMAGHLSLTSQPGKGTEIIVSVPTRQETRT